MTLKYELKFLDYWHLGSGLSAGAKLDSTVTKDSDDIPYASGKTIKGLVREMAKLLYDDVFIKKYFGGEDIENGICYFANATLDDKTKNEIVSNKLQDKLYDVIASTKIGTKDEFDKNGKQVEAKDIAVDNSLREIEVTIPISLYGEILDIESKEDYKKLEKSLEMIKRMGLNRNRGLGRCVFTVGGQK